MQLDSMTLCSSPRHLCADMEAMSPLASSNLPCPDHRLHEAVPHLAGWKLMKWCSPHLKSLVIGKTHSWWSYGVLVLENMRTAYVEPEKVSTQQYVCKPPLLFNGTADSEETRWGNSKPSDQVVLQIPYEHTIAQELRS